MVIMTHRINIQSCFQIRLRFRTGGIRTRRVKGCNLKIVLLKIGYNCSRALTKLIVGTGGASSSDSDSVSESGSVEKRVRAEVLD